MFGMTQVCIMIMMMMMMTTRKSSMPMSFPDEQRASAPHGVVKNVDPSGSGKTAWPYTSQEASASLSGGIDGAVIRKSSCPAESPDPTAGTPRKRPEVFFKYLAQYSKTTSSRG